jgi:hypothetical protein
VEKVTPDQWRTQDFFRGGGVYTMNLFFGGRGLHQKFFRGVLHQEFVFFGGGVTPGTFRGGLHQEFVFFWGGGYTRNFSEVLHQEFFFGGFYTRNFFGGRGSTNVVAERGQREWGSGGGSPLVRGSTQFAKE